MNVSTLTSIFAGAVAIIGATWGVFEIFPTKTAVEADQHALAARQAQTHTLDWLDLKIDLLLQEIEELEEKEETEGITPTEARELDRLHDQLERYEQFEEQTRSELMQGS